MTGVPPPTKRRKSRFGSQPSKHAPPNDYANIARRQNAALAIAAKLSSELGFQREHEQNVRNTNNNHIHHHSNPGLGNIAHAGLGFNRVFEDKVYIPKEDYPDINFVGLILGPKGLNQKRMQAETGCRILVKGKGASKASLLDPLCNEPLHVYISADSAQKVRRGVQKINDLIRGSTEQYADGHLTPKEYVYPTHIEIEIPNSQIGVVIGKQGTNLQRIQDITRTAITISPENLPNNPLMKLITIKGDPQQCQAAKNEVYRTIQELHQFRARLKQKNKYRNYDHENNHDRFNQYGGHGGHGSHGGHGGHGSHDGHYSSKHDLEAHRQTQLNNPMVEHRPPNSADHRNYATSRYDPNFEYPEPVYPAEELPPVHSGSLKSGFCEVVISNNVVGLIIGKNACNVKSMKDRTRCDIRVQKDEETLPNSKTRLVALRGCPESIEAARQEIAKVAKMQVNQKFNDDNQYVGDQGAQAQGHYDPYMMQAQAVQQQMMYANPMMYQQMMYQGQYGNQYNPQYQQYVQQQWAQSQQHIPPPPPPPDGNNTATANANNANATGTDTDAVTANQAQAQAKAPAQTQPVQVQVTNPTSHEAGGSAADQTSATQSNHATGLQAYLQQCATTYALTVEQLTQMYPQYYQQCLQYYEYHTRGAAQQTQEAQAQAHVPTQTQAPTQAAQSVETQHAQAAKEELVTAEKTNVESSTDKK